MYIEKLNELAEQYRKVNKALETSEDEYNKQSFLLKDYVDSIREELKNKYGEEYKTGESILLATRLDYLNSKK